jgi:hypothetical protein
MEEWFYDEEWPVKMGERYVSTRYLMIPYRILNTMIFKVYGEETITHFRMDWFPMAYMLI